ncbi:hypothetical protein GCM10010472_04690 [Pseudonocardia halophobica]|uniref:Uncharacterized protein n=1 Tax=Pseudonocardia halophobica TaxID=29401 RepID=A0A9W6L5H1_9PSEU|nr:hypothetical protein GCM10017577_45710 [Pseudonocardia halophobica]
MRIMDAVGLVTGGASARWSGWTRRRAYDCRPFGRLLRFDRVEGSGDAAAGRAECTAFRGRA